MLLIDSLEQYDDVAAVHANYAVVSAVIERLAS
jgi:transcriptional/translational regulatory protein YebC/TACO1